VATSCCKSLGIHVSLTFLDSDVVPSMSPQGPLKFGMGGTRTRHGPTFRPPGHTTRKQARWSDNSPGWTHTFQDSASAVTLGVDQSLPHESERSGRHFLQRIAQSAWRSLREKPACRRVGGSGASGIEGWRCYNACGPCGRTKLPDHCLQSGLSACTLDTHRAYRPDASPPLRSPPALRRSAGRLWAH
jgi:hypothetical protein